MKLRWLLVAAGALLVVLAGALAALPWLVDTPKVQAYISQQASQALGRPVRFASLSIALLPRPAVRLRGLSVADDPRFGATPFLTVEEGRLAMRLRPLLSGRVELTHLTLDGLRAEIVEDGGRLNIATLGAGASAPRAAPKPGGGPAAGGPAVAGLLSQVRIANGALRYQRRGARGGEWRLEDIAVTLAITGRGDGLAVEGRAVGQPGAIHLRIAEGTLSLAAGRPLAEAPLRARVDLEAGDVAALAAALFGSPTVAGPIKARLELGGTVAKPAATGELRFERLNLSEQRPQCSRPSRRTLALQDLRVPVTLLPARLESQPLRAQVAGGSLSVSVTADLQTVPGALVRTLALRDISAKGVQLSPILVDYLCQSYAVSGPLDLTGEALLRPADPWRTLGGAGRLQIGHGKVVGAGALRVLRDVAELAGVLTPLFAGEKELRPGNSPLDFDAITATYRIAGGVVSTEDLLYRSRAMTVAGAGTYRLLDGWVDMAVTLSSGRTQVKAEVTGSSAGTLRVIPTAIRSGERGGIRKLLERLLR
ncbi:MAG: AsmA family protein [Candidatus Rokubacteria bacterium]|nr:AsmA family protein [Candidatus Rokubacteria bacterium]